MNASPSAGAESTGKAYANAAEALEFNRRAISTLPSSEWADKGRRRAADDKENTFKVSIESPKNASAVRVDSKRIECRNQSRTRLTNSYDVIELSTPMTLSTFCSVHRVR